MNQGMLSVDEALAFLLAGARSVAETENVATLAATGSTRAIATRTTAKFTLALAVALVGRTFTGKLTPLGRAATRARALISARRACAWTCARTGTASRTVKCAPITTLRCAATITARTIIAALAAAPLVGRGFILHPRGAEAEAAQSAQIDFIQVCGRRFLLGSVVVHGI